MKFKIDPEDIVASFDKIANDLLLSQVIVINNSEIEITEIEFFFLKEDLQGAAAAFKPTLPMGRWHLYKQGIGITLQVSIIQSGIVLINGIKKNGIRVNGPQAVLTCIFEAMNNISTPNVIQLKAKKLEQEVIVKQNKHILQRERLIDFTYKGLKYAKKR